MLIVALVLAVIGLAALVTAVVTSNELIAWVCIVASAIGVLLLIVDAVRERSGRGGGESPADADDTYADDTYADDTYAEQSFDEEYPEETPAGPEDEAETTVVEQADDELTGEDRNR